MPGSLKLDLNRWNSFHCCNSVCFQQQPRELNLKGKKNQNVIQWKLWEETGYVQHMVDIWCDPSLASIAQEFCDGTLTTQNCCILQYKSTLKCAWLTSASIGLLLEHTQTELAEFNDRKNCYYFIALTKPDPATLWECELWWPFRYNQECSMNSSCSNLTFGAGDYPDRKISSQGCCRICTIWAARIYRSIAFSPVGSVGPQRKLEAGGCRVFQSAPKAETSV